MAEDTPEIVVNGGDPYKNAIKKPMSAWKTGLIAGAGTLNPIIGIVAGITKHFQNKNYMERAAADLSAARHEDDDLKGLLSGEMKIGDPAEKRLLDWANTRRAEAMERIAGGDRQTGEQMLQEVHAAIKGLIGGDIQQAKQEEAAQKNFQREMIGNSAKMYRDKFENTNSQLNGINRQAQQILDLVADKDFDPNKPINKAHLAELLSMGGLMFKDSPDMLDGLTQGVSAVNGIAGGIVGGIATMFKSSDFKVTAEDYNRLALNAMKYGRLYGDQTLSQLGDQARILGEMGKKVGVLPEDSNLHDYITGGEKELRTIPNPVFTGGYQPSLEDLAREKAADLYRATATQQLINQRFGGHGASGTWSPPIINRRPTN